MKALREAGIWIKCYCKTIEIRRQVQVIQYLHAFMYLVISTEIVTLLNCFALVKYLQESGNKFRTFSWISWLLTTFTNWFWTIINWRPSTPTRSSSLWCLHVITHVILSRVGVIRIIRSGRVKSSTSRLGYTPRPVCHAPICKISVEHSHTTLHTTSLFIPTP